MAKVRAGIFGRPLGKISDLVFGAARDRQGKVATVRALTIPSNPNTAAQQLQREKFAQCLYVDRMLGPDFYQDDWNRSVGQLPGFQSVMSILLNAIDDTYDFAAPADTPLGTLHFPDSFVLSAAGAANAIDVTFGAELGLNGTVADEMQIAAILAEAAATEEHPVVHVVDAEQRDGSPYQLDVVEANTSYLVVAWFVGAGTADGLTSIARWELATSGST